MNIWMWRAGLSGQTGSAHKEAQWHSGMQERKALAEVKGGPLPWGGAPQHRPACFLGNGGHLHMQA